MPQKRYWAHWPLSTDPGLAAAVFVEILDPQTPTACTWEGVPDQPTIYELVRLLHSGFGNNSGSASRWTTRLQIAFVTVAENALNVTGNDSCEAPKDLPELFNSSPPVTDICQLVPIRWFENADDVRP